MKRSRITVLVTAVALTPLAATAAVVSSTDVDVTSAFSVMGQHHGSTAAAFSERDYLIHMVAHHQEAVDAAGELARSERPVMRAFGRSVVATQSAQIRSMQRWLEAWYDGPPTDTSYRPMMRDLTGLSGDRLDRAFLQDMIVHHMAAVMTSQHLLAGRGAEHAAVAGLARTIRDDQHREIVEMRGWLVRWFGVGGSHGPAGWMSGHGPGMMR